MYTIDTIPRLPIFYGESQEDLALMPTTEKIGEGEYPHAVASLGSRAVILETTGAKKYMLRSTGWVEIVTSGGGGTATDYNTLINKPTINGTTIEGSLTADDISVAPKPVVSDGKLII